MSAERARTNELTDDRFYRFERRHGTFTRTIGLPQGVSEDGISADYKNGVLEIHVAKPEQAKPRRIQVGSARAGDDRGRGEPEVALALRVRFEGRPRPPLVVQTVGRRSVSTAPPPGAFDASAVPPCASTT